MGKKVIFPSQSLRKFLMNDFSVVLVLSIALKTWTYTSGIQLTFLKHTCALLDRKPQLNLIPIRLHC